MRWLAREEFLLHTWCVSSYHPNTMCVLNSVLLLEGSVLPLTHLNPSFMVQLKATVSQDTEVSHLLLLCLSSSFVGDDKSCWILTWKGMWRLFWAISFTEMRNQEPDRWNTMLKSTQLGSDRIRNTMQSSHLPGSFLSLGYSEQH